MPRTCFWLPSASTQEYFQTRHSPETETMDFLGLEVRLWGAGEEILPVLRNCLPALVDTTVGGGEWTFEQAVVAEECHDARHIMTVEGVHELDDEAGGFLHPG